MSLAAAVILCALSDSASAACEIRVQVVGPAVTSVMACEAGALNALDTVISVLEQDVSFQVLGADAFCYPEADIESEVGRQVLELKSAGFPVRVRMYK